MKRTIFYPFLFLLLVFSLGIGTLQGQTVEFVSGYPKLNKAKAIVGDDTTSVEISFFMKSGSVNNPVVKISLPTGLQYCGIESVGNPLAAPSATMNATGDTLTVAYTGILQNGETIDLKAKFSAICGAKSGSVDVAIYSGSGTTPWVSDASLLTIEENIILTTIVAGSLDPNPGNMKFEVDVRTNEGRKDSFQVKLRVPSIVYLENFTFAGSDVSTVTKAEAAGSTDTIYTLTLTTAEMGGVLDTNTKRITFNAEVYPSITVCNPPVITYQTVDACGTAGADYMLTINYVVSQLIPNIKLVKVRFLSKDDVTEETNYNALKHCWDMTTGNIVKHVFTNIGEATAHELVFNTYRASISYLMDTSNLQYSINNGPFQKPAAGEVEVTHTLPDVNTYKEEYRGKPNGVRITFNSVTLAPGDTITFLVPHLMGDILKDTAVVFAHTDIMTFLGMYSSMTAMNNCGMPGKHTASAYYQRPSISALSSSFPFISAFRANETATTAVSFHVSQITPKGRNQLRINISLPSWLSLDGSTGDSITITDKNNVVVTPTSIIKDADGSYSVYMDQLSSTEHYLHLKYKSGDCTGGDRADRIHYRIYQKFGKDSTSHCFPELYRGYNYQEAILVCNELGVTFDEFRLHRLSKGLRDDNDDGIPDDGTIAHDSVINHDYYMSYPIADAGMMIWRGTMVGNQNDTCRYLYAAISSPDLKAHVSGTPNLVLDTTGLSIRVKHNGIVNFYPIRYMPGVNNNSFYLMYDATSNPLVGGDSIEIQLLFKTHSGSGYLPKNLKAELFASHSTPIANPLNSMGDVNRLGTMPIYKNIGVFNPDYTTVAHAKTFTDKEVVNQYLGYNRIFQNGTTLLNSYYAKEVRRHMYLSRVRYSIPKSYAVVDDTLRLHIFAQRDNMSRPTGSDTISIPLSSYDPLTNTYEYDVASVIDTLFDGSNSLDPSKKLILPDDYWYYQSFLKIQPTYEALSNERIISRAYFKIPGSSGEYSPDYSAGIYDYQGPVISLVHSPDAPIPARTKTLSVAQVTFSNGNNYDIYNNWLYVAGNVDSIYTSPMSGSASTVIARGEGYQGRWIKLADTLTSSQISASYQLNFDYLGGGNCTEDTVTIYAVSTLKSATENVDTANALNPKDYRIISGKRHLFIHTTPAKISGSLTLSTDSLVYDTTYMLKAEINSRTSEGPLGNPSMVITIPAGQICDTMRTSFEYPIGNIIPYTSFPDSVKQRIRLLTTESATPRTYTFNLYDFVSRTLMPGYDEPLASSEQETRLHLGFIPKCGTNLMGLQYEGMLEGESSCGLAANGNGGLVYSPKMYAYGLANYAANVTLSMPSANRAFNEIRTADTLEVVIVKLSGGSMGLTDSVLINLPEDMDINGNVSVKGSGSLVGIPSSATMGSNTTSMGRRSINLSVATSYVNSTASVGLNDTITYSIPVVYTPNGILSPVHDVEVDLTTEVQFASHCLGMPARVAAGNMDVALVTFEANPAIFCHNMSDTLRVLSNNFAGEWYSDTTAASLETGSAFSYKSQIAGDSTLYVSALFNGEFYGHVPVKVIVRDSIFASMTTQNFTIDDTTMHIYVNVAVKATVKTEIFYRYTNNLDPNFADTMSFKVPAGTANYTWDLNYDTKGGIHYYQLISIVDSLGCEAMLNPRDSIIVKVDVCHPDSSFTLNITNLLVNDLPYGKADTLLTAPNATLGYHWLVNKGIDPKVNITTSATLTDHFKPGVTQIIWTATDVCNVTVIDTQLVVVNLLPCDGKDTLWNIDGTFNTLNTSVDAIDAEGNSYAVVRIGCDCWTKENLISTKYGSANGGGSIGTKLIYSSNTYPDTSANLLALGRLYTWEDATKGTAQGICPDGWSLPSVANYVGLLAYSTYALCAPGADYWLGTPVTNATDFSAIPAGYYDGDINDYYHLLGDAYFWTSDFGTTALGKACHLHFGCPDGDIINFNKGNGASVRCVKK